MNITELRLFPVAVLLAFNVNAFSADFSKSCADNSCRPGNSVITYYSKDSPAVGYPTKQLSLYANYIISMSILSGLTEDQQLAGDDANFLLLIRKNAHVSDLKAAMKQCWRLKNNQHVKLIEYADNGSVKIVPKDGGRPYWTQSNHIDRE